jgi:hypothetical protein
MRTSIKRKLSVLLVLVMFTLTTSCGYFLYPSSRGKRSGRINTMVLVMDILWLLPGLVPGVIALAVDFSSGSIYASGGRAKRKSDGRRLVINAPLVDKPTSFTIEVREKSGEVLWQRTSLCLPNVEKSPKIVIDLDAIVTNAAGKKEGASLVLALRVDGERERVQVLSNN